MISGYSILHVLYGHGWHRGSSCHSLGGLYFWIMSCVLAHFSRCFLQIEKKKDGKCWPFPYSFPTYVNLCNLQKLLMVPDSLSYLSEMQIPFKIWEVHGSPWTGYTVKKIVFFNSWFMNSLVLPVLLSQTIYTIGLDVLLAWFIFFVSLESLFSTSLTMFSYFLLLYLIKAIGLGSGHWMSWKMFR